MATEIPPSDPGLVEALSLFKAGDTRGAREQLTRVSGELSGEDQRWLVELRRATRIDPFILMVAGIGALVWVLVAARTLGH